MQRSKLPSTLTAVFVLSIVASTSSAQQLVAYGAAEAGGGGSSLFLLGASLGAGRAGWSPVLAVDGYHITFPSGPGTTTSNTVFGPSAGLAYQTGVGAWQGRVGYDFVSSSAKIPATVGAFPIPASSKSGVFATLQGDYWGTGERSGQLIGTYSFANDFLWTRARGMERVGGTTSPLMFGAEGGFLGGGPNTKTWGFFVGPSVGLRVTQAFHLTLSGGYRANTGTPSNASGYLNLEGVYVFPKF